MKHNRKIKQSLYLQLADELREGIAEKRWRSGDLLPSETQLCREYGVSRGTVVKAVELLLNEGLVQRRQGVGTFVTRPTLRRQPGFLLGFSETVLQQGRIPSHKLLEMRHLSRAEALQYGCDEAAVMLHRIRLVDAIPWAVHRSLIPLSVADNVPALGNGGDAERQAAHFSLYKALNDAGYTIDHAEERVQARLATAQEADLLTIELPAAIITVHRKSFDPDSRLLELIEAIYLGDSYTYETRLVRTGRIAKLHEEN